MEQQKEIWKDIKGYEGYYKVSNFGNVKSLNYRNKGIEHLIKPVFRKRSARMFVRLSCCSMVKRFAVHRLVAQAFLNNYSDNLEVIHIDGNIKNNKIENLKIVSRNERINKTKKSILCLENGKVYLSIIEASKELNISVGAISLVCTGKNKTAGNLHFKYKN